MSWPTQFGKHNLQFSGSGRHDMTMRHLRDEERVAMSALLWQCLPEHGCRGWANGRCGHRMRMKGALLEGLSQQAPKGILRSRRFDFYDFLTPAERGVSL
jgi:hypothetical protein